MKYRSKVVLTLIVIMITMLNGCSKDTARTIKDPVEMPDIVFLNYIHYYKGDISTAMTFYDKNGNHYTTSDYSVCCLSFEQLVEEYAAGNLDDKIKFHTTCNVDELFENYQKLCQLSKNQELEIVRPGYGPDVEANREIWYGLYYDKDGNIQSLIIHEEDAHGDHMANDERANEIYEWYIGTFKK